MEQTPRPTSPPVRSLDRQVVLDEDEYTAALSHIIKRDFFPSLAHLDATNDYLDALRKEDPQLINVTVRRLEDLETPAPSTRSRQPHQTPSQTPWAAGPSDTPLAPRASSESEPPQKRPRYDTDISLDEFQAKYTSEDNSSFIQILEDENRQRREKYGWAWEAQKRVEAQRDRMLEGREMMMIEPGPGSAPGVKEKLVIEAPRPVGLITDAPKDEDSSGDAEPENEGKKEEKECEGKEVAVISKPSNVEEEKVDVMAPKKDTRPAGVDGWKFKARNALMFTPDADVSPHTIVKLPPAPTRGEPKAISYSSTRLPEQHEGPSSGMSEPPSPTRSRIDAAIQGTTYKPHSPTHNGFSLLPSMPSPTPSELGPAAVKQLMTWGTLGATPRILSSDDPAESKMPPPSTPFHIPEPSARETIGHKLSNKAVKSLRAKAALMGGGSTGLGFRTPTSARGDGSMPPPSWTPRKAEAAGSLTPAAKRLLDRTTMSAAATRRAEAMGKSAAWEGSSANAKERDLNKVRWTPSPALMRKR